MFYIPLILVCSLSGRDCQAVPGPVQRTEELCQVSLEVGMELILPQLPPNVEVVDTFCATASEPV